MHRVIVQHKDGREYDIPYADFARGKIVRNDDGELVTYETAGFRIVRNADGSEYEAPKPSEPEPPAPKKEQP